MAQDRNRQQLIAEYALKAGRDRYVTKATLQSVPRTDWNKVRAEQESFSSGSVKSEFSEETKAK